MLSATYKNTLKNILRSGTFWLIFGVLIVIVSHGAISGYYVGDDEPGVILSYHDFVEVIANSGIVTLAMYALPLTAIVTTVIVLLRDYGDDFFEIERAGGIQNLHYLLGRLAGIITVVTAATVFSHSLCLHLYIGTRGGVHGIGFWDYLAESFVRLLRFDFCVILPGLLFYLTLTFLIGVFLKRGYATAAISCICMLAYYFFSSYYRYQYIGKFVDDFFNYYSPIPTQLRMYFQLYDTENNQLAYEILGITPDGAMTGFVFLIGISVLFSACAYFRIRKRTM